mgnify:CR=1 FL=1
MGLELPKRSAAPKRLASIALLSGTLLLLGACSEADKEQMRRLAMPEPITAQAPATFDLWKWAWVAAMVVGVITWGLIFYAIWRFRRRHEDEVPVQTRYNLPLEVFYTITPILMVVVFFFWTVDVQDTMTETVDDPDVTLEVVGQQWSWTFNYGLGEGDPINADPENHVYAYDEYAFTAGTASVIPTLVLPVDQTVQFNLHSPDVIHSFGIPEFLMKLDVIPGQVNSFQATPTVEGTFPGKCYELCGTSHSRMLFNVEVVSLAEYEQYIASLPPTADGKPVLGGADSTTVPGLETQEGAHE